MFFNFCLVTVKDHKIVDILLLNHKNNKGKIGEVINEKVLMAQSLQVDTVSGTTNSSKVILKAIEYDRVRNIYDTI